MRGLYRAFSTRAGYERAQRLARSLSRPLARDGRIARAPGPLAGWTTSRDLPAPAKESSATGGGEIAARRPRALR